MGWSPLQLSPSAGAHLPPLLISTAFTSSSFAVHLTDLTYIWSETLSRTDIVQRSREEATSIDPSEGSQFKIFLEKIKLGLAGGKGTTLALTINAGPDRPSLVLSISVDLPGRLAALQWPVRLSAAPQALVTSQLTVPLLQAQHAQMQEKASLVEVLKDKDHVIQKLMDKLEDQGTDLGQLFPQAAGKVGRKLDRKKAEDKVRGIARFDVDAWRQGLSREQPDDTTKLISEVFAEQTDLPRTGVAAPFEDQDNWWEDIQGLTVHLDSGKISTKGPSKINKPKFQPTSTHKDETQAEDEAFQTQLTGPTVATTKKLAPSKPTSRSTKTEDSTDDDDEDLDAPSQRSKIPDSVAKSPPPLPLVSPRPAKRLGALGKKRAARRSSSSPPPKINNDDDGDSIANETASQKSSPSAAKEASPTLKAVPVRHHPQKKLGRIGGQKAVPQTESEPEPETEAEEEEPEQTLSSLSPPPTTRASPNPKKGKLGQIGGRRKKAVASVTPEPEPELELEPTSPPTGSSPASVITTTPAKRKLGALGTRKVVKEEEGSQRERGRGNSQREKTKTKIKEPEPEPEPEKRETSLERADRKRVALKKELEQKAKAPVKKKRRF